MSLRYYANAPATALSSSCSNTQTSLVVNSVTGLPIQYPYTLIIDRGTATEEAVSVTNASGTTLTVTRAIDSTTAFSHSIGAVVEHGITAQDIREPNAHINASTAVHGLAGAVVGTTDAQALTNKDLSGAGNTFPTSLATLTGIQTLTNKTIALGSNTVSGTRAQFNTAMTDDDFASLTGTETLTNKTVNLTSNTLTGTTAQFNAALSDNDFATLAGTEALTNKDLSSATNTLPATVARTTDVPLNLLISRVAAQSIPNNAFTAVSFDTETTDTDNMFTATSTNVTVNTGGLWLIVGQVGFAVNGTGGRGATLRKNGTDIAASLFTASNVSSVVPVSAVVRLVATDVITMTAFQNSGGALNTNTVAGFVPTLEMVRLGA